MARSMAGNETQAAERTAPRPRRKLFDFPCHYAELDLATGEPSSHCWHIRRGDCASAQHCLSLPVYREYLALSRCARLLRAFDRRVLSRAVAIGAAKFMERAKGYRDAIGKALREVGL